MIRKLWCILAGHWWSKSFAMIQKKYVIRCKRCQGLYFFDVHNPDPAERHRLQPYRADTATHVPCPYRGRERGDNKQAHK